MDTLKRAQVIMLPTENKTYIGKFLKDEPYLALYTWYLENLNIPNQRQGHHLYIISDEEIKEGDWFIGDNTSVKQCTSNNAENINFKGGWYSGSSNCKKIIATTDTSLNLHCNCKITCKTTKEFCNEYKTLPQPSQQFITKYIEEYNKGNIITDVLVEYEEINVGPNLKQNLRYYPDNFELKLKVNSKDNTITIKRIKTSWNREEVIALLKLFEKDIENSMDSDDDGNTFNNIDSNKWIKENL